MNPVILKTHSFHIYFLKCISCVWSCDDNKAKFPPRAGVYVKEKCKRRQATEKWRLNWVKCNSGGDGVSH